jgi:hypothetical protein
VWLFYEPTQKINVFRARKRLKKRSQKICGDHHLGEMGHLRFLITARMVKIFMKETLKNTRGVEVDSIA